MLQDLKELGFLPNEIKVYESLLGIGETTVGGIINDLKFIAKLFTMPWTL